MIAALGVSLVLMLATLAYARLVHIAARRTNNRSRESTRSSRRPRSRESIWRDLVAPPLRGRLGGEPRPGGRADDVRSLSGAPLTMRLVVDASLFRAQQAGGLSRLYRQLWPRLCELEPSLRVEVVGGEAASLPDHPQIVALGELPAREAQREAIWHSSYQATPRWAGPMAYTWADAAYELEPRRFGWLDGLKTRRRKRLALARADLVFCFSADAERRLASLADAGRVPRPRRVVTAPLGCSLPLTDSLAAPRQGLLWVGSRAPYKRFDLALEALAASPRAELRVVGGAPSSRERADVDRLGLGDRLRWLGRLDDRALCEAYDRASALVYPCPLEGFGLPTVEAMARGCVPLLPDVPLSHEVAGEAAVLFAPDQVEALAEAYRAALEPGRLAARRERGVSRAGRYRWERCAASWLAAYRELRGSA